MSEEARKGVRKGRRRYYLIAVDDETKRDIDEIIRVLRGQYFNIKIKDLAKIAFRRLAEDVKARGMAALFEVPPQTTHVVNPPVLPKAPISGDTQAQVQAQQAPVIPQNTPQLAPAPTPTTTITPQQQQQASLDEVAFVIEGIDDNNKPFKYVWTKKDVEEFKKKHKIMDVNCIENVAWFYAIKRGIDVRNMRPGLMVECDTLEKFRKELKQQLQRDVEEEKEEEKQATRNTPKHT